MAGKKVNARKIAVEYANSVASVMRVEGVMLFGSSARGQNKVFNDIDMIVLSRDFSKMRPLKRLQLLNRLRTGSALTIPMDILGLTPQEFSSLKKSESANLRGIYRDARLIYPAD